jgi:hypothetical protein
MRSAGSRSCGGRPPPAGCCPARSRPTPWPARMRTLKPTRGRRARLQSEERVDERGLAGAGAADHAAARARLHRHAQAVQHQRQARPVAHLHVLELDLRARAPPLARRSPARWGSARAPVRRAHACSSGARTAGPGALAAPFTPDPSIAHSTQSAKIAGSLESCGPATTPARWRRAEGTADGLSRHQAGILFDG